MRASLTSLPRGRSCSFSAARRRPLLGGHESKKVGERPPRLVLEPILENLQPVDPVQPEVAEGASHLAPGGERPGVAPVRKPERVDYALASRLRLVDVVEARFAVLADRAAKVLEAEAEPSVLSGEIVLSTRGGDRVLGACACTPGDRGAAGGARARP